MSVNLRYLCLVYEEEAKADALAAHEYTGMAEEDLGELEQLRMNGHCVTSGRLQSAEMAATVRVRNSSVFIAGGPDVGTKERLTGFYLIDARDLNDAIRIAAKMPRARLGWIEVWPLEACNPH